MSAPASEPLAERALPSRILIVTDAWYPQVNGVVRTLDTVRSELEAAGCSVRMLTPEGFRTVPLPTYKEIRLALATPGALGRAIEDFGPEAIHVATEGPLGFLARRYCIKRKLPFTTAFHTRFDHYVSARVPIPTSWVTAQLRRFHAPSSAVLVATESMRADLEAEGFARCVPWTRGVDTRLFVPREESVFDLPRPIMLYVGRVAVEKNLPAFLELEREGSKVVVGSGPDLEDLRKRYPEAHFVGPRFGEELARAYASADVFVFPSKTDTFGLVMLEALACGVPVAAYPVTGPLDVIGSSGAGALDESLWRAIERALEIDPDTCRAHALRFSWAETALTMRRHLAPLR